MSVRKNPDLTVLHGNPGNRPVGGAATSKTGRPLPPADLSGEAFAEWCRVTAYLEKVGRIEMIDFAALVVYCSSWSMYDDARKAFEKYGPLVTGRDGGMVRNPAAQIMNDASKTMALYGAKFGFSPKDRQMLGIGSGDPDQEDDIERRLSAL